MHAVLLVDDERAVLDGLQEALDWDEYGFSGVLTAQSAQEAMRVMHEHAVDLIILDILMPGMTGLEMLRGIRQSFPDIHCILISAHSKFEYAREALQLNVENYLLKPIDINELRETVQKAAENISAASESFHNLFERNVLERWLNGRITGDELVEHSRFTRFNVLLRRYYAMYIFGEAPVKNVLRVAVQSLEPVYSAYSLLVGDREGVVLVGGRDLRWDIISQMLPQELLDSSIYTIACGSEASGNGEVSRSMADAKHLSDYARLCVMHGFLSFAEIPWDLIPAQVQAILADALSGDKAQEHVLRLAMDLAQAHRADMTYLRTLYAQFCLALCKASDTVSRQFSLPAFTSPYTIESYRISVQNAISKLLSACSREQEGFSPIIRRILTYISDNLTSSVSIKQFCTQTKTNAAYIGRLFKEETGVYFSDYVSMLRIRRAKVLLEETDDTVGNIARQVGMYDVSYFTQCFKKQERMSPSQYRQSHRA